MQSPSSKPSSAQVRRLYKVPLSYGVLLRSSLLFFIERFFTASMTKGFSPPQKKNVNILFLHESCRCFSCFEKEMWMSMFMENKSVSKVLLPIYIEICPETYYINLILNDR